MPSVKTLFNFSIFYSVVQLAAQGPFLQVKETDKIETCLSPNL